MSEQKIYNEIQVGSRQITAEVFTQVDTIQKHSCEYFINKNSPDKAFKTLQKEFNKQLPTDIRLIAFLASVYK
jgi:hypothetical protein